MEAQGPSEGFSLFLLIFPQGKGLRQLWIPREKGGVQVICLETPHPSLSFSFPFPKMFLGYFAPLPSPLLSVWGKIFPLQVRASLQRVALKYVMA